MANELVEQIVRFTKRLCNKGAHIWNEVDLVQLPCKILCCLRNRTDHEFFIKIDKHK